MPKHKLTRKNIDSRISDVRKPRAARLHEHNWQPEKHLEIDRPQRRWRKTVAAVAAVVGVAIVVYVGYLLVVRSRMETSANLLFGNLQYLIFGSSDRLSSGREEIRAAAGDINSSATGVSPLKLLPILREIPSGLSQMGQLAGALVEVGNSFAALRTEGLNLFFGGRGGDLLALLKNTDTGLKKISALSDSIRDIANKFDVTPMNAAGDYLVLGTELRRQTDMLDALITLLDSPESHILLLLEDTSVLRPGGGRIAAYADISLAGGGFKNVEVTDISTAEKSLGAGLIPPIPLQVQETTWKIRDANWFFDFPSSAAKVKSLIETADSSRGANVQYSGVIAVTPEVVTDLADALGQLQVDGIKKPITKSNLDSEAKRLGYVRFMNMFLPAVAGRMQNLTGDEGDKLAGLLGGWIANREVRLYFQEPALNGYVLNADYGGGMWPLPNNFSGDYLALARADIGTKAATTETIGLRSRVGPDGIVHDNLTIAQTNKSAVASQDFMQVFTPDGSHLVEIAGNTYKKISPPVNYNRLGYAVDADVAAIENTRTVDALDGVEHYETAGRTVFGFWLSLSPRATRTVSLTYDSPRVKIEDDMRYSFVIERQPGEHTAFNYSVEAPPGWQWHESQKQVFYYSSDYLAGRTIVDLTLERTSSM